jgi:hypothetical protein
MTNLPGEPARRAFANGETTRRDGLALTSPYEPLDGSLELLIGKLFAELFDVDRIGANDDFFELGGDSVLAEPLSMGISEGTGLEFPVSRLVRYSTPRKIARLLDRTKRAAGEVRDQAAHEPVRPPIYFVPGRNGFVLPRPTFIEGLAPEQELRMFELPGLRRDGQRHTSVEQIANAYVEQLNAEYSEGPVLLAGFCTGSLVALEVAHQLAAAGRPVQQLVLVDPIVPANVTSNIRRHIPVDGLNPARRPHRKPRQVVKHVIAWSLFFLLTGRWTDGSRDEDFQDSRLRYLRELKFNYQLRRNRFLGKAKDLHRKYPGQRFSIDAQAKLYAAYRHYRPSKYDGPVAMLLSRARRDRKSDIWPLLLPQHREYVVLQEHKNLVGSPELSRIMQSIFDSAGGLDQSATPTAARSAQ